MANTIAYTSSAAPTGSLKSGVISINLNDQIIGQNYNWRNGIVFSNQYIIYSDTFTQGIDIQWSMCWAMGWIISIPDQ